MSTASFPDPTREHTSPPTFRDTSTPTVTETSTDTPIDTERRRPVAVGRLLVGLAAIVIAVSVVLSETVGMPGWVTGLTPAQWMLGIGSACVALGLIGLIRGRRRPH